MPGLKNQIEPKILARKRLGAWCDKNEARKRLKRRPDSKNTTHL